MGGGDPYYWKCLHRGIQVLLGDWSMQKAVWSACCITALIYPHKRALEGIKQFYCGLQQIHCWSKSGLYNRGLLGIEHMLMHKLDGNLLQTDRQSGRHGHQGMQYLTLRCWFDTMFNTHINWSLIKPPCQICNRWQQAAPMLSLQILPFNQSCTSHLSLLWENFARSTYFM